MFFCCYLRDQIVTLLTALLICIVLTSGTAHANQSFHVNMAIFGIWLPQTQERLDMAVWFPAKRQPKRIVLDDWMPFTPIRHNRIPDAIVPGFYPLVFISHDTAGSKFAHHDLAEAIASKGFIVVAPDHTGDSFYDNSISFSAETLRNRPLQIVRALETVLSSPELSPYADETRIGVIGIGFGCITAMQLLGVEPQKNGWATLRTAASEQSIPNTFFEARLEHISRDMETFSKQYGRRTYTPTLDVFAPQLMALDGTNTAQENESAARSRVKPNLQPAITVINDFHKQHLGIIKSNRSLIVSAVNELAPSSFTETQTTFFVPADWLDALPQSPVTGVSSAANKKKPLADLVHRRPATQRKILAVVLISPAGGTLFSHLPDHGLQTPSAILHPAQNEIYPEEIHLQPYLRLFATSPRILSLPKGNHYVMFSPCLEKSERRLIGFCGDLPLTQQKELAIARDTFLSFFLKDSLGNPLPAPEPSGYVAAPNTAEPPTKVNNKQPAEMPDKPVQERRRTRRTR